eukprot:361866-Chlamydomonas_euryale.AAC.3
MSGPPIRGMGELLNPPILARGRDFPLHSLISDPSSPASPPSRSLPPPFSPPAPAHSWASAPAAGARWRNGTSGSAPPSPPRAPSPSSS